MKKKLLTMLAVIVLGMALVCGVSADDGYDEYDDFAPTGTMWFYDGYETLTISGNGVLPRMWWFYFEQEHDDFVPKLNNLVLEDGVTKILGNVGYPYKSVTISKSVIEIGESAFYNCKKLTDVYYTGSESDWKRIKIAEDNDPLFNATIHYNYKPESEKTIAVLVNSAPVVFPDQQPILKDERTLVPARGVFEALGATVTWDDATKTVTIMRGDTLVTLTIGQSYITVNGEQKTQDVPAQLINERTMIPVRAVAEAFGCDVGWDGDTYTVSISM